MKIFVPPGYHRTFLVYWTILFYHNSLHCSAVDVFSVTMGKRETLWNMWMDVGLYLLKETKLHSWILSTFSVSYRNWEDPDWLTNIIIITLCNIHISNNIKCYELAFLLLILCLSRWTESETIRGSQGRTLMILPRMLKVTEGWKNRQEREERGTQALKLILSSQHLLIFLQNLLEQ